jgi:hypothetical protein
MASPTRDEFLSYVHQPRRNRDSDPEPGSPIKSTMRHRWRELRQWAVEQEARAYRDALPDDDEAQMIDVPLGYWGFIEHQLWSYSQPDYNSNPE